MGKLEGQPFLQFPRNKQFMKTYSKNELHFGRIASSGPDSTSLFPGEVLKIPPQREPHYSGLILGEGGPSGQGNTPHSHLPMATLVYPNSQVLSSLKAANRRSH